jgi:anthranilate synthase component 2
MSLRVLLVDNFDSFTFNLVEALERLGARVSVFRNDVPADELLSRARDESQLILLSPGPGHPSEAGACLEVIDGARGELPVLGVCLGHQAILMRAGAEVGRAPEIVHGKASALEHDGRGPFAGLPSPLLVGRYHSLGAREVPARFTVHARVGPIVMAVSDREARQVGLQFHPESILTPRGDALLAGCLRFLQSTRAGGAP